MLLNCDKILNGYSWKHNVKFHFSLFFHKKLGCFMGGRFLRVLDIWLRVNQKMFKGNFLERNPYFPLLFYFFFFNKLYYLVSGYLSKFWGLFRTSSQSSLLVIYFCIIHVFWNSPVSRWMVSTTLLWTNCAIPLQALLCCIDSSLIWIENFLMETKCVITQSCYSHFSDKNHSFQKQQRKLSTAANEPCKIISPPQWWQEAFKTTLNCLLYGHNGTWGNYSSLRSPLRLYYLLLFKDLQSISFHSG